MECRESNIIISSPGGTAGKNSKTYKVSLPSAWIKKLGINDESRQIKLAFDGNNIVISRICSMEEFKSKALSKKHIIYSIGYYDNDQLCSLIYADFTSKELQVENYTDKLIKTAFGRKKLPDWADLIEFLEERCLPRQRAGLNEYLDVLGIDEYDPMEIIKHTSGRMAEDNQWLKLEELSWQ